MSFVHGFEAGTRGLLMGALMRPTPARPRVHRVTERKTNVAVARDLIQALETEKLLRATAEAEVRRLEDRLAVAEAMIQQLADRL